MSFSNRELTPQSGFAKNGLAAQISGNEKFGDFGMG
jgi:hypothetical protein